MSTGSMTGAAYRQIGSANPLSIVLNPAAGPTSPHLCVVPDGPYLAAVPDGPQLAAVPDSRQLAAVPDGPQLAAVPDGPQLAAVPDSRQLAAVPDGPVLAIEADSPDLTVVADKAAAPEIGVIGSTLTETATVIESATVAAAGSAADVPAVAHRAPVATKLCVEGHPNNAYGRSCRVCGRPFQGASEIMAMTPVSIGRLLMEDGSAVRVADALVIGRHPVGDDGRDTLTVTGRQVSRRHLLLQVRGWDLNVTDCDSTNGTFLTRRGERGRRRVPADGAMAVRIGDSIHFGSRWALVVTGAG